VNTNAPTKPPLAILLAEDHADSRELFEEILRAEGHAVTVAGDGNEALALLLAGEFELAVLDIGLPRLDGIEVARLARERLGPRAPRFVAMTGYTGRQEREALAAAGFDTHLAKPVLVPDLLAALDAKPRAPR
jgi:CheY-like chemotaxis protein